MKFNIRLQILASILIVLAVSACLFPATAFIGYKTVALLLMMTVSLLAMTFDIIPVLLAAGLTAVIWNFFFIPPIFTFHIDNTEDLLMFFLYFIIALVNTVLTYKIRIAEKNAKDKEEKENSIRLYNTLLNSLSHELRTPIATILGAIDTIKDERSRQTNEHLLLLLNQIDIAAIRLNTQVENLLNMSRLETGLLKINKQWCDINELINLAIQKISETDPGRKISFIADEQLPLCKIDSGLIDQVLKNILSNAIQYTDIETNIEIQSMIAQNILVVGVTDHGNGVSPNILNEIFQKFFRAPESKPGGTGLGLSIAKGFTEAHGGSIKAENIIPHGLKITIQIPVETSYMNNLKNE